MLESYQFTPSETKAVMVSAGAWRLYQASTESGDKLNSEIVGYRSWLESRTGGLADRLVGETFAHAVTSWGNDHKSIAGALTNRSETGLTAEAVAGFLSLLEKQSNLRIDLETVDQISAAAADSEEVQAIADRLHKRNHR